MIVYIALGMGANVIRSFFVHFIPFLIQKQVYTCEFSEAALTMGETEGLCTRENICDGDERIISWDIDYSDNRSLHNW